MILNSLIKSFMFRKVGTLLYLSSHLNKTYGSRNHFGQNTKYSGSKNQIADQNSQSKKVKTQQNSELKPVKNVYDEEPHSGDNNYSAKRNKEMAFFLNLSQEAKLNVIEEYRQKEMIKELSILCRELYYLQEKSDAVWNAIEDAFIHFLNPPYDKEKIRSLSLFLNGLGKTKRSKRNYQVPMMEILPQSSIQSFTQIVVMISRMGPMSEEFANLVEKLYWKRKEELGSLEINLINYALAKNGRKIDTSILEKVDSFTLRGIALMLKAFDRSGSITHGILTKCVQPILSRKAETSFFELKHLINVYFKYQYLENYHILHYFDEQYRNLSRNINEQTLQDIWQYLPQPVNKNKLPPTFIDQVIRSLKYLKTNKKISERSWKLFEMNFSKFENKDIKEQLKNLSLLFTQ